MEINGQTVRVINRMANGMVVDDVAAYVDQYGIQIPSLTLQIACDILFPDKPPMANPQKFP